MLETGQFTTIKEIAKAEKINPSYVSRVLTLLAPALVENLLAGRERHPPSLDDLMRPFPTIWSASSTTSLT
jgi:hypothetical protein